MHLAGGVGSPVQYYTHYSIISVPPPETSPKIKRLGPDRDRLGYRVPHSGSLMVGSRAERLIDVRETTGNSCTKYNHPRATAPCGPSTSGQLCATVTDMEEEDDDGP